MSGSGRGPHIPALSGTDLGTRASFGTKMEPAVV